MSKNAIIAITVFVSLLCLYQFTFTFKSRSLQADAIKYATNGKGVLDTKKKQHYIDSIWNKKVYSFLGSDFTYKQVKDRELSLGLDLQGGMHVTLEVSPVEILVAMSGNSTDPNFLKAIENAKKAQQTSTRAFVDVFGSEYAKIAPNSKLADIFSNTDNRTKINLNSSNAQVLSMVSKEVESAIDRSFQIVRKRIDQFGVANPTIQRIPGTGRILVELPGAENPERVRKLLSGAAKLEFFEVHELGEISKGYEALSKYLTKEDERQKGKKGADTENRIDDKSALSADTVVNTEEKNAQLTAKTDTLKKVEEKKEEKKVEGKKEDGAKKDTSKSKSDTDKVAKKDTAKKDAKKDSLQPTAAMQLLMPNPMGFTVKIADTARVNEILARNEVKNMFPATLKLMYDVKADAKTNTINLYPIKKGRGGKAPLEGDVITDARQEFDNNRPVISMQMNGKGAKLWKKLTGANVNRKIAIVLDNVVYSAPNVNGEIPTGNSQISGNFTIEEANDLANVLKAGKLPAPMRIVEGGTIGPSLGKESINQGVYSMLIGLGLVVIFMVLYYKSSGFIANIALLFNIFFIIGILASFGLVLTLPGMAGIVLTIGMSVDANVLIFERIREEIRNGSTLNEAIALGYEKAYSSIIDANVTTFLIGAILAIFGAGSIKGFAITLMIGIVCSVFTAVFITRIIIEYLTRKNDGKGVSFDAFILKNVFADAKVNFLKLRYPAYIFSGSIIAIGMVLIMINGLSLGVDFKGGRSYIVKFGQVISVEEARQALSTQFKSNTEVKTYNGNDQLKITTSELSEDESEIGDKKVETLLLDGLKKFKDPKIEGFSKVGATIADDIYNTSLSTIFWSLVIIFLYILIRFRKWQYSLGAVIALFHDVLVVFAGMAIARLLGVSYEVDQVFIAAMLTVIGYSINDTVVVFDRIREFAGDTEQADFATKLNSAINDTLSRTIMTSGTTLIVVLILFLLGGSVLAGFSYALLVGILIGTYSSIFIASPIVLDISAWRFNNNTKPIIEEAPAKA